MLGDLLGELDDDIEGLIVLKLFLGVILDNNLSIFIF